MGSLVVFYNVIVFITTEPNVHLKYKGSLRGMKFGTWVYISIIINADSGLLILTQSLYTRCDSIPISYNPLIKIDIFLLQSYSYFVI